MRFAKLNKPPPRQKCLIKNISSGGGGVNRGRQKYQGKLKWPRNKSFYDIRNLLLILISRPKRVEVPSGKIDGLSRPGMCEPPPSTSSSSSVLET